MNAIEKISGKNKGTIITIMAGVHGNELAGVKAIEKLSGWLKKNIIAGTIFLITANPKAIELNQREYIKNMNRFFINDNSGTDYEDIRIREIQTYLDQSDYLIDLHNTLNKNSSTTFLICEHSDLGKFFDTQYLISGFDKLHPGGSDSYMNGIGKIGLCLETGSIYFDDGAQQRAEDAIINFLTYTKNIPGKFVTYNHQTSINFNFIYKNKHGRFRLNKGYEDFERVNKDQLIGFDGEMEIICPYDARIIFAHDCETVGSECFCLGKET